MLAPIKERKITKVRTRGRTRKDHCDCPVCSGLQCLERPRYFAGQLLTEAELTSEQAYVLAKNRMQNRYLHGSGIVCGLQVTCHECEGWVTVHPGYALGPCGNDVVVCGGHDFDVIKAIRECRKEERRRGDCDPWRGANKAECKDVEENWCITIRYKEQEGRPTTALRSQTASRCGCGKRHCNCNGNGNGGGRKVSMGSCEPTRVFERYELGVMPAPKELEESGGLAGIFKNFGKVRERICDCLEDVVDVGQELSELVKLIDSDDVSGAQIYSALCKFKDRLRLEIDHAHILNCGVYDKLDEIAIPVPDANGDINRDAAKKAASSLFKLLQAQIGDCFCFSLMPACPSDPCEDRLILACVTVRGDDILRICHAHRDYVLTPNNLMEVFLSSAMSQLCCSPTLMRMIIPYLMLMCSDEAGAEWGAYEKVQLADYNKEAYAMQSSNPDLTRLFTGLNMMQIMTTPGVEPAKIKQVEGMATLDVMGRSVDDLQGTLDAQGIKVHEVVDLSDESDEEKARSLERDVQRTILATPFLAKDDTVRVVSRGGQVVGFQRISESERLKAELSDSAERIKRLETQVEKLLKAREG